MDLRAYATLAVGLAIFMQTRRDADTLHADWTKLRTLDGTGWLLIGTAALTVTVSAAVIAAVRVTADGGHHPTKAQPDRQFLGQAVTAVVAASPSSPSPRSTAPASSASPGRLPTRPQR